MHNEGMEILLSPLPKSLWTLSLGTAKEGNGWMPILSSCSDNAIITGRVSET